MEEKLIVFISSRINDEMKRARQTVREAIEDLPLTRPWLFEEAPAAADPLDESYLRWVGCCDLFILLLGEDITDPVRVEWETATQARKPRLVFLKKGAQDEAAWEFAQSLGVKWKEYHTLAELKGEVQAAVGDELIKGYRAYGVSESERAGLQEHIRELHIGDVVYGDKVVGDKVLGDKITYTRSKLEELNDYLARAVAAYEAQMYQHLAPRVTPPDQPYKFLYAFEIEDTDIFFGRDTASEAFHQTLLRDYLTILHAKSGAGKTSLLNAGLSPRLIGEGRLPVYARAYDDPVRAIKQAIAPPSSGPWPELLPRLDLHEFLGLACAHLSRQTRELVVILDQFEEFFIFWPERDHRQPFIDALADCYDDKSLPVRFIIALRKDYYSDLADFQKRIPTILYNEYRLDTMTREEAQDAITGPVAKLGRPVTYEQDLLDTLLDDLARGEPVRSAAEGIELPHLQIICTRLYKTLAEDETVITLASYKKLGRAEAVLGGYLNDVLDQLPGRGGAIAREVLKELVSSEATKRVLSYAALAARVEAGKDKLDDVLTRLVDARLLRRDEVAGEVTYEMAHEYLIEEIKKWIDQADLVFKQAEELLAREMENWRLHGSLIPGDRLEVLHAQRERFRGLDDEAWECILHSALQADFAVEDWAKLAGEASVDLLQIFFWGSSQLRPSLCECAFKRGMPWGRSAIHASMASTLSRSWSQSPPESSGWAARARTMRNQPVESTWPSSRWPGTR
jgi:hypothetical protein